MNTFEKNNAFTYNSVFVVIFIVLVQKIPVTNAFTKTSWSSDISTKLPLTRTKNPEASTERNTTIGTQLSS